MQEIKFNSVLRTDTTTKVSYIINEISVLNETIDEMTGLTQIEYSRVQLVNDSKEFQGVLSDVEILTQIKSFYDYKNYSE